MSHFAFIRSEWPDLYESAAKAEAMANPDPRAACFYTRRALELAVAELDPLFATLQHRAFRGEL